MLIAVSILVSAVHALRPIFPGREARIAAFFGLIHGLAFASTLSELGLGRGERLAGILSFNLGIETMQMAVVALTLPSLILMSRTRAYPWLRVGGALFAGVASVGWIVERMIGAQGSVRQRSERASASLRLDCWRVIPSRRRVLGIPKHEVCSVKRPADDKFGRNERALRHRMLNMRKLGPGIEELSPQGFEVGDVASDQG